MIAVKLIEFSLPGEEEKIYYYTVSPNKKYWQTCLSYQDSGDMDTDLWHNLYSNGDTRRIQSIDEVEEKYHDFIPYCSDEFYSNSFDLMIKEFFAEENQDK